MRPLASATVIVDEKMANGNMIAECFAKTTSTNPLFLSRSDTKLIDSGMNPIEPVMFCSFKEGKKKQRRF